MILLGLLMCALGVDCDPKFEPLSPQSVSYEAGVWTWGAYGGRYVGDLPALLGAGLLQHSMEMFLEEGLLTGVEGTLGLIVVGSPNLRGLLGYGRGRAWFRNEIERWSTEIPLSFSAYGVQLAAIMQQYSFHISILLVTMTAPYSVGLGQALSATYPIGITGVGIVF